MKLLCGGFENLCFLAILRVDSFVFIVFYNEMRFVRISSSALRFASLRCASLRFASLRLASQENSPKM
jgi:hypothetical protein